MRVKTSITLPQELLGSIGRVAHRSVFLERASRAYLSWLEKATPEDTDAGILNA